MPDPEDDDTIDLEPTCQHCRYWCRTYDVDHEMYTPEENWGYCTQRDVENTNRHPRVRGRYRKPQSGNLLTHLTSKCQRWAPKKGD